MGIQSAGPAGSLAIPEPPAGTEPPVGTPFPGILHPGPAPTKAEDDPACFRDLHLDEIVDAATSGLEGFRLAPFFRTPCPDGTCVLYRQAVFRDLEEPAVAAAVRGFAAGMAEMRSRLGRLRKARYTLERRWWLVRAAVAYCEAVTGLHDTLDGLPVASEGLRGLGRMLLELTGAEAFRAIERDAAAAVAGLAEIRYRLHIAGGRITVTRAGPDAPDYGAEVLATFERFRHGAGREYRFAFEDGPELNHVEAAVAERVALLFPAAFSALAAFAERHAEFVDPRIARLEREIQFYLGYLGLMDLARPAGGAFCYPEVSAGADRLQAAGTYDLALARRLASARRRVVPNDIDLRPPERLVVVTGPNQGGKTTFARTVGQILHLAALGVPVPGTRASLPLVDGIHTLFEREEAVEDLVSKLEDDLRRMRDILGRLTERSAVIMNETFSSTTVADQAFINRRILEAISETRAWCVTVTFLDELSALTPATVSMVSTVDPANTAVRTLRILRRPADGRAYARAIADQYRLGRDQVAGRVAR